MVYFYCNVCGDSLKKNQVEKHFQKCRQCRVLSCVDCGTEFHGVEYEKHTKCISEEEKYSGKNFKPKPGMNKGEQKQEQWIEQVQQAIGKVQANPKLKNLLEQLKTYPNIPRKRAKFENFLSNSLRVRDSKLVGEAWNAISAELTAQVASTSVDPSLRASDGEQKRQHSANTEPPASGHVNGDGGKNNHCSEVPKKRSREDVEPEAGECEPSKKSKKRKHRQDESMTSTVDDVGDENCVSAVNGEEQHTKKSFSWTAVIVGALKQAPNNQLRIKKLRKKVLSEFNARHGDGKVYTEEKLFAKFMYKINKTKRLKVHKDTVQLIS